MTIYALTVVVGIMCAIGMISKKGREILIPLIREKKREMFWNGFITMFEISYVPYCQQVVGIIETMQDEEEWQEAN